MPIHHNKVLVVDDQEEHGREIVSALWKANIPVHFYHFDYETIGELATNDNKLSGMRALILDIDLTGDGAVGRSDYALSETIIKSLLDENNGPWVLIAWTSHHNYTDDLFDHLRQRLPEKLRPIAKKSLPKDDYINAGTPSKPLQDHIQDLLTNNPAFDMLRQWESYVTDSISEVISTITQLATFEDDGDFNGQLTLLLEILIKSEAGVQAVQNEYTQAMHRVLSDMLKDCLDINNKSTNWVSSPSTRVNNKILQLWKRRINTMLNLAWNNEYTVRFPGNIYQYPSHMQDLPIPRYTPSAKKKLILEQFFNEGDINGSNNDETSRLRSDAKTEFSRDSELLLLDITPPCDHSNRKAVLRKYVVMLKAPCAYAEGGKKPKKGLRNAEYLIRTPSFISPTCDILSDNTDQFEGFVLIINLKLIITMKDDDTVMGVISKKYKGRMKEKLLTDCSGAIGRHMSRSGYTSIH